MKRDEAAQLTDELFGDWGPSLVRYAYRATSSWDVAEDVVQEVFLSLYRDLISGKQIDNVRGFTLNAVRRQVWKHDRNKQRHREHLCSHEIFDLMPGANIGATPPDEDITGMMWVLTPREEEVVLLRIQAMKYREIGAQLGIDAKTVGTLLTRALQKLRKVASTDKIGTVSVAADARTTLQ